MSEKGNAMSTIFRHILLNVTPPLNRVLEAVIEFRTGKYLHKLVQFLFDIRKVRTKKKNECFLTLLLNVCLLSMPCMIRARDRAEYGY